MVRPLLSAADRERGRRLGAALKQARAQRSMTDVAAASGVPLETLRKIEAGRVPTPAFFTVVALSAALDMDLATLITDCSSESAGRASLAG
jgi:transcriptional regulator with XRE-family HTH domain